MAWMSRRSRPELEGLEGRRLLNARFELNGKEINDKDLVHLRSRLQSGVPTIDRSLNYTTPEGARVTVRVQGPGSIRGSAVDAGGALDLVYGKTNGASRIKINVRGGTADLKSVRAAALSIDDSTGVGGHLLGALLAPKVDLVPNGKINLSSGIGKLELNSIGRNTQILLRDLPQTFSDSANASNAEPGTTAVLEAADDFALAPTSYTWAGRTLGYLNGSDGSSVLTSVSGLFAPTANLVVIPPSSKAGPPPAPPGVVIKVDTIDAGDPGQTTLDFGQIYGYDPVANTLIRFNTDSGEVMQSINVGGTATDVAGVGLGRNGRQLVVLLGRGTTVEAFDAASGVKVGQFSTANLATSGLNVVDGIAFTGTKSILTDSNGQVSPTSTEFGIAIGVDVAASLASASGEAVTVTSAFATGRGFEFSGGATGVAGSNNISVIGAAHFDTAQPLLNQLGFMTIAAGGSTLRETSRIAVSPTTDAGLPGMTRSNPNQAVGSVESLVARVTSVANAKNVVTLYTPNTYAAQGTIVLDTPNPLAGLSESFHPETAGTALINVQGNIQSFRARSVRGLALNDAGNLNIIRVVSATDSTFFAQPVGHVLILNRNGVTIVSSARSVGDRSDVLVDPTIRPLAPILLPN